MSLRVLCLLCAVLLVESGVTETAEGQNLHNTEYWNDEGIHLYSTHNYTGAIQAFNNSLNINHSQAWVLYAKGSAYCELGNNTKDEAMDLNKNAKIYWDQNAPPEKAKYVPPVPTSSGVIKPDKNKLPDPSSGIEKPPTEVPPGNSGYSEIKI